MAPRHKPGTSEEPIEILDSDDETQTLRDLSFIDLTQDDVILYQTSPILQQPATINKDFPTSSAINTSSHSRQPSELASRQFSFAEGQTTILTFENEAKTSAPPITPPSQVLLTGNEDLIGELQQLMSEGDADSELSDVMDRSTRRRLRRVQELSSRTLQETGPVIPKSSAVARGSSPEVAVSETRRTNHGRFR
jgi:hypothetical protein